MFQNKPLADAYSKKLLSITPDRIGYGSYTNFFTGHTLKGNLRFCINEKCYEMFLDLEEVILEYLREGKEIWFFPDSKIPIFFSETLNEQIELDYFFSMDGRSEYFFKNDPDDKSFLSCFRKKARNYCRFLEEQNLDDLYRYAWFCQL